jgi:ABC-type branched-subunit amino acid transport system substrate-binding protein
MFKHGWKAPAAVVALAVTVAACGSSGNGNSSSSATNGGSSAATSASPASGTSAPTGSPYVVFGVGDLSGPLEIYGKAYEIVADAAAKWINQHGGVDGHPMKVVYANDQSDSTTAVNDLVSYITEHGKPNAVFPSSGNEATSLIPAASRYGILVSSNVDGPSLLLNASKYPTAFETSNVYEEPEAAELASHHYKKVGILEQEDPYATAETPLVVADLKKLGIASVVVTFPPTATSVQPQLSQLKSDGVDVVLAETLGATSGYALQGRAALGWNVPVQGDPGLSANDPSTLVTNPSQLKGVTLAVTRSGDAKLSNYPGFKTFLAYEEKYGGIKAEGAGVDTLGWDSMMDIYAAAKLAKSIDPQKMTQVLENHFVSPKGVPWAWNGYQTYFTTTDHENNPSVAILNKEYAFPPAQKFNSVGQVPGG